MFYNLFFMDNLYNAEFFLRFTALVFFNLLCILGIFLVGISIALVQNISSKANELSEKAKDLIEKTEKTLVSSQEIGKGVLEVISNLNFPFRRKSNWFKVIRDFFF